MKIALFGYGKMGKEVERMAPARRHELSGLQEADVAIDFSHPEAVLTNARQAVDAGVPLVIGTTGWEKDFEAVKVVFTSSECGCVYGPNFSLGVHIFSQILAKAASLVALYDLYDVAGLEVHHNQKVDSPSGTAKNLTKIVQHEMPEKAGHLAFSSVRVGDVSGTHTVIFDSAVDTITLTHAAKNRSGFALGAIFAAELIHESSGFWSFEDLIKERECSFVSG